MHNAYAPAVGLLALAFASVFAAKTALGHTPPQLCHDYYSPSGADNLADDYLRNKSGTGISVCQTISGPGNVYYAINTPSLSGQGVCRFTIAPIYPHPTAAGATAWDEKREPGMKEAFYPVRTYATVSATSCPNQSDPNYAGVGDMSDDDILRIAKFWNEVSKSNASFDRSFAQLSVVHHREDLQEFRRHLLNRDIPDSISYRVDDLDYETTFIFSGAMYAIRLRPTESGFLPSRLSSGVTWGGFDF